MCIFNRKKRRVTVLLGAGAMIEATGVGTGTITKKVLEAGKHEKLNGHISVLEQFANDFNQKHARDRYGRNANFEDLFDLLEELAGYTYTEYIDSASIILSDLKKVYKDNVDYRVVSSLRRKVLDAINLTVASYDQQYSGNSGCNDSYNGNCAGACDNNCNNTCKDICDDACSGGCDSTWMTNFFHNYIKREKVALDVFNLNYDTWIEQILEPYGYEDGFAPVEGYDDFQRFIVTKYLNHGNKHTISHLHGSICFDVPAFKPKDINMFMNEEQEYTLYKYKDFSAAEAFRKRRTMSDMKSQSGHVIFPVNIITGRMKTDKILWAPMQVYMYGLIKALMENEELFIIGYGFGDQYINHLLFQYLQKHRGSNRKIHMITKCEEEQYYENVLSHGDPFQDRQAIFSQCMMKGPHWCNQFHMQSRYKTENSEIYIDGFKKFCEEYVGC